LYHLFCHECAVPPHPLERPRSLPFSIYLRPFVNVYFSSSLFVGFRYLFNSAFCLPSFPFSRANRIMVQPPLPLTFCCFPPCWPLLPTMSFPIFPLSWKFPWRSANPYPFTLPIPPIRLLSPFPSSTRRGFFPPTLYCSFPFLPEFKLPCFRS